MIDFKRCPDGMPCSGNCMPFGCQRDARPAASESDTPETDALVNSASCSTPLRVGELIDFARSLERRLSLDQTEIKGHMRIEDDLKQQVLNAKEICDALSERHKRDEARIAELEKALSEMEEGYRSRCNYCGGDILICAGLAKLQERAAL